MTFKAQLKADRRGNQQIRTQLTQGPLSSGAAVKAAERMLKLAGFDVKVDGKLDAKTTAAISKFDASVGNAADGLFDATTFDALKRVQDRIRKHKGDTFLGAGQAGKQVAAAEQRLRKLGYDVGKTDGVFDAQTAKAVKAFKKDEKITGDSEFLGNSSTRALARESSGLDHKAYRGRVTRNLKQHRRLDAATATAAGKQHADGTVGLGEGASGRAVKNVQQHLRAAGFNPNSTDGKFDSRTRAALEAFQKKSGLSPSGRVNARTWKQLSKATFEAKDATSPAQRLGEKSAAVKRSENVLRKLGYKSVKADGLFDAATKKAVRKFEKKFPGMGSDGAIGEGQLKRMKQVLHAKEDPGSGPLLRKGFSGKPVKALEQRLKRMGFNPGKIDGKFSAATAKAVKRFQKAFALGSDGVVGKTTWRMLGVDVRGKVNKPGSAGGPGNLGGVSSAGLGGLSAKVAWAAKVARSMGLTVTSTTGGTHAPGSYHYSGRAVDVAGSPSAMARFYRFMATKRPTELFHDPIGGIKNGVNIGAIGGHGSHVHVAF